MSFNATDYPYRTVVQISTTFSGGSIGGSGVLLSPDEVLTASHVVYNPSKGSLQSITVKPAYNQGSAPYGSYTSAWAHYFQVDDASGNISKSDSQSDYAIIHLSTPVNSGIGYMGYVSNYGGGAVHVTGYPDTYSSGTMVDVTETVTRDSSYTLLDGTDTHHGSSGGPVWFSDNGNAFVVGVVSSGDGTHGYNTLITNSVFAQIQAWIAQDDYSDPVVDVSYYTSHNPDVARAPINKAYHYDSAGWHELRDPSADFSTVGYLASNLDVARAGINPLQHYDQAGWREGRDPAVNFDTQLYLEHNPDVRAAGIDPLMHYLQSGRNEGRQTFTAVGQASVFTHGSFDPEFYLLANPDVAKAALSSGQDTFAFAYNHFHNFGWHEGRNPNAVFDTRGYLAAYADVARANIDPLYHYDQAGWHEGRDPSGSFDTKQYLSHYADVAAAHVDPLTHYLQSGIHEGRNAYADGHFG